MRFAALALAVLLAATSFVTAYVESPHTLGRCIHESTNVVLLEIAKVSKEKNLIYYKKVQDLKGKHPETEIKHNIGKRGFHEREWKNIMAWAAPGKRAVFFHNGGASETCIGTYWYQCYREGAWWGMSHAEPYLLRTYCGDADKLAAAVTAIVQGREVAVPCMLDQPNRDFYHQRKGKLQRLKASLKLLDYNPRRDFVAWGSDGEIPELRTVVLLPEGAPGWKFLPADQATSLGTRWQLADFDDAGWRRGKAPLGYGEPEISKRVGMLVAEKGKPFLFRRDFDVPADLFNKKETTFRLRVASDNSAIVFLNGKLADQDPVADHEFTYWNRDVELPRTLMRPGRNVIAVEVRNRPGSSDLYLDIEIAAEVPVPAKAAKR